MDADGSLLVLDTGGWYKLCCPTSQLWKPEPCWAASIVCDGMGESPADPRGFATASAAAEHRTVVGVAC